MTVHQQEQVYVHACDPWRIMLHVPFALRVRSLAWWLRQSIEHTDAFWAAKAEELLQWDAPFTHVQGGTFGAGDINWCGPARAPQGGLLVCV